ncbi:hypothetical protein Bint_2851 [Brachyspira intermedia PWS/A]|uniref:PorT family protein n=1 Tax=Brachyspira intermedia (strain ATCC 51140 / PWS/A) TaxID=1045858 RepID=G0EI90_BRAIP|nr:hypothetical protein [Brachyspira intermedia]AEM23445.1 hypothetical protein Bint_2851 [Brachyspira intermedia PWS/A]
MKNIKKLSLVIALILVANIKVFAASGFEAALSVPLGASFGIFNGEITTTGIAPAINSEVGFDSGVHAQIGYMFDFGGFGLSLLGDLGYSYDSYRYSMSLTILGVEEKTYQSLYLHSFQLGVLPKFNFGNFALGIGGGVKIPMGGTSEVKYMVDGSEVLNQKLDYKSSDVKSNVIGYIKATFDYSFFFTDNMAFVLGAYIGYDIGLSPKGSDNRFDSFDVGGQIGFKFGPRVGS